MVTFMRVAMAMVSLHSNGNPKTPLDHNGMFRDRAVLFSHTDTASSCLKGSHVLELTHEFALYPTEEMSSEYSTHSQRPTWHLLKAN